MRNILHDPRNSDKILQMTSDTMFIINYSGICVDIAIRPNCGLIETEEELIGKNIFNLLPIKTLKTFKEEFNKVVNDKIISTKNYELPLNKEIYFFKCIMYPYEEGLVLCQYRDITDRSKTKLQLEKMNNELQVIEKGAKIGQWTYDSKTQIFNYKGYTGAMANSDNYKSISLEDYLKMMNKNDQPGFLAWLNGHLHQMKTDTFEYRILLETKTFFIRLKVISREVKGENVLIEGYHQNITDIIKLDENLMKITKAVDYASEDIFAIKPDGTLTFANEQFRKHYLLTPDRDLSTVKVNELPVDAALKERWINMFQEFTYLTQIIRYVTVKPFIHLESILAIDFFSYLVKDSDGEDTIWTFGRDISEQIRYENQVKELNQIMHTVLENIPIEISVKDTGNDFRYIYRNGISYGKNEPIEKNVIGKTDFDIYPDEVAITYRNEDLAIQKDGKDIQYVAESSDRKGRKYITNKLKLLINNKNKPPLIVALRWDITEIKLMEKELIAAKEKAEVSDKLKSAFLANMSHEIRTPLNAIVGFSRVIADTQNAEERMDYYNIVEANNARLLQLINEILDLSRIESGMMEFTEAPINLNVMCQEVYDMHRFRCSKDVQLIFVDSDPNLWIYSDKNRLIQVFSNLIGNAIKFTEKGNISFGYRLNNKMIECFVKDTGMGIANDKIENVFDRFTKLDSFAQGTGLGLSICKSIVERLKGTIKVESKMGDGTTFTFTHPYVSLNNETLQIKAAEENETTEDTELPVKKDRVILVAEDNESNFKLLNVMIGKCYTLIHANDGVEVISLFEKHHPDLILMDIKMPNMDGLNATRIIREVSPDIPIIALSAYAYEEDRKVAFESGCNEFIAKPISKDILIKTLKKYL